MIIMGCDGVWETRTEDEIFNFVWEGRGILQTRAEEMLDWVIGEDTEDGIGLDNLTCLIINFDK